MKGIPGLGDSEKGRGVLPLPWFFVSNFVSNFLKIQDFII